MTAIKPEPTLEAPTPPDVFDIDLELVHQNSPDSAPPGCSVAPGGTDTWYGTCGFTCSGVTGVPCAC